MGNEAWECFINLTSSKLEMDNFIPTSCSLEYVSVRTIVLLELMKDRKAKAKFIEYYYGLVIDSPENLSHLLLLFTDKNSMMEAKVSLRRVQVAARGHGDKSGPDFGQVVFALGCMNNVLDDQYMTTAATLDYIESLCVSQICEISGEGDLPSEITQGKEVWIAGFFRY